jgi:hypothetical protein
MTGPAINPAEWPANLAQQSLVAHDLKFQLESSLSSCRTFFPAVDASSEFLYTWLSVAVASGRTLLPFSSPDTEQAKGRIENRFDSVSLFDTSI